MRLAYMAVLLSLLAPSLAVGQSMDDAARKEKERRKKLQESSARAKVVSAEDLKALAAPALRHRVILNFEGEAEGIDIDTLIGQIVDNVESSTTQAREPFVR